MDRAEDFDDNTVAMLKQRRTSPQFLVVGSIAGCVWLGFAMLFDYWSYDGVRSLIPSSGLREILVSVLVAASTGTVILVVFRRAILSGSRRLFFALPVLTLPAAIVLFSVLVWLARLALGSNGSPDWSLHPPGFMVILDGYVMYGLFSVFAPILYVLALATQWMIQKVVGA